MLSYQIIKKRQWREYFIPTVIEIGIVVAVLSIGAIIEWQMITQTDEQTTGIHFSFV
jgi:hypothetical protein